MLQGRQRRAQAGSAMALGVQSAFGRREPELQVVPEGGLAASPNGARAEGAVISFAKDRARHDPSLGEVADHAVGPGERRDEAHPHGAQSVPRERFATATVRAGLAWTRASPGAPRRHAGRPEHALELDAAGGSADRNDRVAGVQERLGWCT